MKQDESTTRRELLALLAALGISRQVLAQDPVTSDPRSFRIVVENDRVRVLEYRSGPGLGVCGQGVHYHPERVTVTLTEAKVRISNAEGRTAVRELPAGPVFYAPAETQSVENVGGSGTRIYILELKGHDWSPSTGT